MAKKSTCHGSKRGAANVHGSGNSDTAWTVDACEVIHEPSLSSRLGDTVTYEDGPLKSLWPEVVNAATGQTHHFDSNTINSIQCNAALLTV